MNWDKRCSFVGFFFLFVRFNRDDLEKLRKVEGKEWHKALEPVKPDVTDNFLIIPCNIPEHRTNISIETISLAEEFTSGLCTWQRE